jgi:hypothetical protein
MALSRDKSMTTDGVWIGNRIYWTLQYAARDCTLQITITYKLVCSVTVFTVLLDSGFRRSSVLDFGVQWLLSSLAGTFQLRLQSFQMMNSQCTLDSLCSLGTDRIDNISPNRSFIVASRSYLKDCGEKTVSQLLRCLETGVFAELFPSNGCLCWFHRSCLDHIWHIIYH